MLENYEINNETLAIVPLNDTQSKVFESNQSYVVNINVQNIINNSCKYFGSSFSGRCEGSKNLLGMSYKLPIIIEETKEIIFFPTSSPRFNKCSWISLKNIENYTETNNSVIVNFKQGQNVTFDLSIFSFENQVFRALRLETILKRRKNA